jgi:hypothetical protein
MEWMASVDGLSISGRYDSDMNFASVFCHGFVISGSMGLDVPRRILA